MPRRKSAPKPAAPVRVVPDAERPIRLRGVRQNNLKGIDVDLPYDRFTVVTGVSGSGKSSLVFDTLYAEGQRRYVESFSAYARQFLDRMPRPHADSIDDLPPAVAVEQRNPVRTSRSTVGTMTELTDHLKLLFAKAATLYCDGCDAPVRRETPAFVADGIEALPAGSRVTLTFPMPPGGELPWEEQAAALTANGLGRILDVETGRPVDVDSFAARPAGDVHVVLDRFVTGKTKRARLLDSAEQGFRLGRGRVVAHPAGAMPLAFSEGFHCADCDRLYRDPQPNLFSFNSPLGACATCRGFGRTVDMNPLAVIPNHDLSLSKGALRPWTTPRTRDERRELREFCEARGIDMDVPWRELSADEQQVLVDGEGGYGGIRGWMKWLEKKAYKLRVRVILARYRAYVLCVDCNGTRRKPEALLWRLGGRTIHEWESVPLEDVQGGIGSLDLPAAAREIADVVLAGTLSRIEYLVDVGLGYLTLDRSTRTLSGGEFQRVNLATALGAALVNTLYVLDEPSVGLHARDTHRLLSILRKLRDRGNTLVVVEHDPDTILAADHVIDLGPGAGERGGEVLFSGTVPELTASPTSLTAEFLRGEQRVVDLRDRERRTATGTIRLEDCRGNNLTGVDFEVPTGCVVAVVGVSGSGKSTLVGDTFYPVVSRAIGGGGEPLPCGTLSGHERVGRVDLVDQTPIGRTPRSNPGTYSGAMLYIRSLLALTETARKLRLRPKSFSFNTRGGRCPVCEGAGVEVLEMQFLANVEVPCEECDGKRFKPEILLVRYRGRSIDSILRMTIEETHALFDPDTAGAELGTAAKTLATKIRAKLAPLVDVGLGYLRLGQSATTLSGGEAQRLKLAGHLALARGKRSGRAKRSLLILDEPTTGLHLADVSVLVRAMDRLADHGHTVLVVEHHLSVIAAADHVIELGPEGGAGGGRIVATGTPEEIARTDGSPTAPHLARELAT